MNPPTFVYLSGVKRYLNLATVVEIHEDATWAYIRTIAPDGRQMYDGEAYSPDSYITTIKCDSGDYLTLTDALAELLVQSSTDDPEGRRARFTAIRERIVRTAPAIENRRLSELFPTLANLLDALVRLVDEVESER